MITLTPVAHAVLALVVLTAIAILWIYRDDHQPIADDDEGAPHAGAHLPIGDRIARASARVVAVETSPHQTRLLLDEPTPPPDEISADGRLWTLPTSDSPDIAELLDVPLRVGTTSEGELTLDLAALASLHVAGPPAGVHSWLEEESVHWDWCLATATTHDGIVEVVRHDDRRDRPLVIATDPEAQHELPRMPAAGRVVVDELATGEDDKPGAWVIAPSAGEWTLSPLRLAVTPNFIAHMAVADERTGTALAPRRPRRRREGHVRAHVLGHVSLTGIGDTRQEPKVVELIAYLATHPAGATEEELKTTVWETRPAKGRFTNVVCDARRLLGTTATGSPLLPNRHAGRYQLHPSVTTDLQVITEVDRDLEAAAQALERIDGRPFTSGLGYDWAHRQGLVDDAIAAIRHAASTVVAHLLESGDHDRAARVTRRCLIAVPLDTTLTALHRDARLAGGDDLGARRIEDEYRTATGQRLPDRRGASAGTSHG